MPTGRFELTSRKATELTFLQTGITGLPHSEMDERALGEIVGIDLRGSHWHNKHTWGPQFQRCFRNTGLTELRQAYIAQGQMFT